MPTPTTNPIDYAPIVKRQQDRIRALETENVELRRRLDRYEGQRPSPIRVQVDKNPVERVFDTLKWIGSEEITALIVVFATIALMAALAAAILPLV